MQWNKTLNSVPMEVDLEESDRLFTFEISKTSNQEQNVTLRPGFTVGVLLVSFGLLTGVPRFLHRIFDTLKSLPNLNLIFSSQNSLQGNSPKVS